MKRFILRSLALVLTLSVPVFAVPGAPGGPVIYRANCASCHGAAGKGGIGPALSDSATWSYAVFSRALLKGLDDHGNAFKSPMPTFGKTGFAGAPHTAPTPAQMKALQAYLKTLK
ncbi:c-type cytochrome [Deinococcus marmoris]|uniref:C-type cytochrome n=1 Tax=Deinococcus marmoris TaxID=249408 RepID=A0A1U7P1V8_9DEIO|nr:cytochrome c [Deinococcus marmoris]OLV19165.1 c-type cytochrome [Deinococcus marmoris]